MQMGVNRSIEKALENRGDGLLSTPEKLGMAAIAGSSSAVIGCPAELLMIHQQKTGMSLSEVLKQNVSKLGAASLYRGLVSLLSHDQ